MWYSLPKPTALRLTVLLLALAGLVLALIGSTVYAAVDKAMRAPLWSENGSYVLVTTDKQCHETNCDGYGVRPGGQDAVLKTSSGATSATARVVTPLSSGHYGIITKIWTADGWYKNLGGSWVYSGHGYGNGYDLYVGQGSSGRAVIYRFAHQKTDGVWFYPSGQYILSRYNTGNKLSWGQVMGYMGSTGFSSAPHLHWELIIGSTRYEPTYSNLDNIGATYGQYATQVDTLSFSCAVSSSTNCSPSVAPLSASAVSANGLALESGLTSLADIPGYGADDVPVMPSPPGLKPSRKGQKSERSIQTAPPLPVDEVIRVLPSGETILAGEIINTGP